MVFDRHSAFYIQCKKTISVRVYFSSGYLGSRLPFAITHCHVYSVVTIPDVAMQYVSRYLGNDAIRIAILVYRISQCLDLHTIFFLIVYTPESF